MKIALVFTNDWELFGDGSGDFYEIQYKPLEYLLKCFENYEAKITIMAEVEQQLKHLELADTYIWAKEISNSWEEILKQVILKNNDVQLHIHPQWSNAKYDYNQWKLDEQWSIAQYPQQVISSLLMNGKNYLEQLLKIVNSGYQCIAFRAGAYYIEPSEFIINELLKLGFKCDTSVTKGLVSPGYYDYNDAYSNMYPWFVSSKSVKYKNNEQSGLLELPICSDILIDSTIFRKYFPDIYYKIRYGTKLQTEEKEWSQKRDQIKEIRYPKNRRLYKLNEKRNLKWYLKKIITKNSIQLDYDYMPSSIFLKTIEKIKINFERDITNKDLILPIVASGHVKDMHNIYNINRILDSLINIYRSDIEFWTLSEAINYLLKTRNFLI